MAIILEQQNINDKIDSKKIGISFPFSKASDTSCDGYFTSTYLTMDAIKVDLANLLNTANGERVMQPALGTNLRKFLFETHDQDLGQAIEEDITGAVKFWLPFITLVSIDVISGDEKLGENPNALLINVKFILNSAPKTLESITIDLGDTSTQSTPVIPDLGL